MLTPGLGATGLAPGTGGGAATTGGRPPEGDNPAVAKASSGPSLAEALAPYLLLIVVVGAAELVPDRRLGVDIIVVALEIIYR